MNMKTKLLIGGAVLAAGATTYIVVKNAKKKKAERQQYISSANKESSLTNEDNKVEEQSKSSTTKPEKDDVDTSKTTKTKESVKTTKPVENDNVVKETIVEDKVDNGNSDTDKNKVDNKNEETARAATKEETIVEDKVDNGNVDKVENPVVDSDTDVSDNKSNDSKKEFDINNVYINTLDSAGKKRDASDSLTKEESIVIEAYADVIKGIESEEEVEKFVNENSTFEKYLQFNSELLNYLMTKYAGEKKISILDQLIKYIGKNIVLTKSEDDVMKFNRIKGLFKLLKENKEINFLYSKDLLIHIAKEISRLKNLVDSAMNELEDENDEVDNDDDDIIESVLRARTDEDDERPVFGNMGLEINTGEDDEYEEYYEEDEEDSILDAKREFLRNTVLNKLDEIDE